MELLRQINWLFWRWGQPGIEPGTPRTLSENIPLDHCPQRWLSTIDKDSVRLQKFL